MTTLQEVADFIDSGDYYNARVAIEYLESADEIEGKLLKIHLFMLQQRTGPAWDTARSLLRPGGEALTTSQRLRALLGAIRAGRSEHPDNVAEDLRQAQGLVSTLSPEERTADQTAIDALAAIVAE